MKVPRGEYLVFRGPCELVTVQGEIKVLGVNVKSIIVGSDETFSVSSSKGAEIATDCKPITSFPSLGWETVAEAVASTGGTVVVLGRGDSGKTYLSKTIYNSSDRGKFVDLDVGQSAVFLPAFLSAFSGPKLWFENPLRFTESMFFGDITPSTNPELHLELSVRLSQKRESLTVIDTDGWFTGTGRKYKEDLLSLLDPDFVILLGERLDVSSDFRSRVVRLRPVPPMLLKSRQRRAERRKNLFSVYFQGSKEREVPSYGKRVSNKGTSCLVFDWLDGLLVGLEENGRVVGAGLLSVSSQSIHTPCESFDDYIMGLVALGKDMRERRLLPALRK